MSVTPKSKGLMRRNKNTKRYYLTILYLSKLKFNSKTIEDQLEIIKLKKQNYLVGHLEKVKDNFIFL